MSPLHTTSRFLIIGNFIDVVSMMYITTINATYPHSLVRRNTSDSEVVPLIFVGLILGAPIWLAALLLILLILINTYLGLVWSVKKIATVLRDACLFVTFAWIISAYNNTKGSMERTSAKLAVALQTTRRLTLTTCRRSYQKTRQVLHATFQSLTNFSIAALNLILYAWRGVCNRMRIRSSEKQGKEASGHEEWRSEKENTDKEHPTKWLTSAKYWEEDEVVYLTHNNGMLSSSALLTMLPPALVSRAISFGRLRQTDRFSGTRGKDSLPSVVHR